MKKIALLLALALPVLFTSCGDKTGDPQPETIPAGMRAADLSEHGFPLRMNVPDSTRGKLEIVENDNGGTMVRVGKNFQVNVNIAEGEAADLKMQKTLITAMDAGQSTFSVDTDTALVYVTKFGEELSRHHFYMIVKIGNDKYVVRDVDDPENQFTEDDVKLMMESARSLRAKPAAPAGEAKS